MFPMAGHQAYKGTNENNEQLVTHTINTKPTLTGEDSALLAVDDLAGDLAGDFDGLFFGDALPAASDTGKRLVHD